MKITRVRRVLAAAAAAVLAVVSVVVGADAAYAASGYLYPAAGTSTYGYYNQNDTSLLLRLLSNPATISSGKCVDMWFDWNRGLSHYDARVARSCRSSYQRDTGNTYETTSVSGINKAFACYGNNNATTSGSCSVAVGDSESVNPNIPNLCTRAWWLTSSGLVQYNSGGSSVSCTS